MSKVPRDIAGSRAVKVFRKAGYQIDHQTGSHIIMYHSKNPKRRRLVIPSHGKLKTGLLAGLIKEAGLTVEEFRKLL